MNHTNLNQWNVRGPALWAALHTWARKADLGLAVEWLAEFDSKIGCNECRLHWRRWIVDHPPDFSGQNELFCWTVTAHNAVNRRLGKPELTLERAWSEWEIKEMSSPNSGPELNGDRIADSAIESGVASSPRVNCQYAQCGNRPTIVECSLGLYGGKPHETLCKDCDKRSPRNPGAPALFRVPPQTGIRQDRAGLKSVPLKPPTTISPPRPVEPQNAHRSHERLILRSHLSPGDILMLTAAVRDLQRAHPGRFAVAVDTSAPELWENNPNIRFPDSSHGHWRKIDMHYPLINYSNQRPRHFIEGYAEYLSQQLGAPCPATEFKGDIHLSESEKNWICQVRETFGYVGRFWIIVAGGKYDFTAKWWAPAFYQRVVDHFMGRIQFVQVGEKNHWHRPLKGVFNLVGKTSIRQLIRLMYHADGVVCPVTFAMHLAAAVPVKTSRLRPCVVIAGGREPVHWEAYPGHHFLHTIGSLPCCAAGGCWRSRCQTVGDGDAKDRTGLCERPVQIEPELRIPQCMAMIHPEDVIRAVEISMSFQS